MAVPKKRRIGCRILNRGSQARRWHLLMLNLTLSGTPMSHLRRLINIPKISINRKAASAPLLRPLPKFKLKPLTLKKKPARLRAFDKELCPFSSGALCRTFEHRAFWNPNALKVNPPSTPWVLLLWHPLMGASGVRQGWYRPIAPTALTPQHIKFTAKRFLLAMQIPHRWGSQRGLLLRQWELSPSHFYLTFLNFQPQLSFSQGLLKLNQPVNLLTPRGPTLKKLWAYIKANPNEGYWAYCMWLQLIKKWKRWIRFPYQYFVRRNIWQRTYQRGLFYESLDGHRVNFLKPSRVAILSRLKIIFPLKNKLKKNRKSFSMLTNLALTANALRFLVPKAALLNKLRLTGLKSKSRRVKNKALGPLESIWLAFRALFNSPL